METQLEKIPLEVHVLKIGNKRLSKSMFSQFRSNSYIDYVEACNGDSCDARLICRHNYTADNDSKHKYYDVDERMYLLWSTSLEVFKDAVSFDRCHCLKDPINYNRNKQISNFCNYESKLNHFLISIEEYDSPLGKNEIREWPLYNSDMMIDNELSEEENELFYELNANCRFNYHHDLIRRVMDDPEDDSENAPLSFDKKAIEELTLTILDIVVNSHDRLVSLYNKRVEVSEVFVKQVQSLPVVII